MSFPVDPESDVVIFKIDLSDSMKPRSCPCGAPRRIGEIEYQCVHCVRVYHVSCAGITNYPLVPFGMNYKYECGQCLAEQNKSFRFALTNATMAQILTTTLANLSFGQTDNAIDLDGTLFFSKTTFIIPHVNRLWHSITSSVKPAKLKLIPAVHRCLRMTPDFVCHPENGDCYGLKIPEGLKLHDFLLTLLPMRLWTGNETDRAIAQSGTKVRKSARMDDSFPKDAPVRSKRSTFFPVCRDPHVYFNKVFGSLEPKPGEKINPSIYRLMLEDQVAVSLQDRAPQLGLSEDRLTVKGQNGYSTALSNFGVSYGSWYFELEAIAVKDQEATFRVGWSLYDQHLQAPCGWDHRGYSIRSFLGTKFHKSKATSYATQSIKSGDTIGCLIMLNDAGRVTREHPSTAFPPFSYDISKLVERQNRFYFRYDLDHYKSDKFPVNKDSKILFFNNGTCLGCAFKNMTHGHYHAAVSLFGPAQVRFNFGPKFKFPLENIKDVRPMCEAAIEGSVQHVMEELLRHTTT